MNFVAFAMATGAPPGPGVQCKLRQRPCSCLVHARLARVEVARLRIPSPAAVQHGYVL